MEKITLFHGTSSRIVVPTYGLGEKKHDYGKGFYLTDNLNLAKEWAVCKPDDENGWVHQYKLDTDRLKILDFQEKDVLSWLAELMKHRDASDSKRYRVLSKKFIEKYGIDTEGYDVIKGWRANASYFYIAKEFVRDNIDMDIVFREKLENELELLLAEAAINGMDKNDFLSMCNEIYSKIKVSGDSEPKTT